MHENEYSEISKVNMIINDIQKKEEISAVQKHEIQIAGHIFGEVF